MRAGKLRHRIQLQARTSTKTAGGEIASGGWATVATEWADVRPATSKEQTLAMQQHAMISHVITVRASEKYTADKRILFGTSRIFEINGVMDWDERGIHQILLCLESVERATNG